MSTNETVEMRVMKFGESGANRRIFNIEAMSETTDCLIEDMKGLSDRFTKFTRNEIYIMHRAFVEAGANIILGDKYSKEEQHLYTNLLKELADTHRVRST